MNTKSVFEKLSKYFGEKHLAVCSLGRTSEESYLHLPSSQVLYLDCLGSVVETAIGIALGSQNTWVYALDTDGSFLSNTSSIYSLSLLKEHLSKYTLLIFDNQLLESSGNQKSRLVRIDWESLFQTWNLQVIQIGTLKELNTFFNERYYTQELQIAILDIDNSEQAETCYKNIDGVESKYLFKRYLNEHIKEGILKPCVKN